MANRSEHLRDAGVPRATAKHATDTTQALQHTIPQHWTDHCQFHVPYKRLPQLCNSLSDSLSLPVIRQCCESYGRPCMPGVHVNDVYSIQQLRGNLLRKSICKASERPASQQNSWVSLGRAALVADSAGNTSIHARKAVRLLARSRLSKPFPRATLSRARLCVCHDACVSPFLL